MFGIEEYKKIKEKIPSYSDIYASQEGEDILLRRLFKSDYKKMGFYIDIGAFDPIRFSTTFHFYLNGWRGINIDPRPGMKKNFDIARSKDINLELGVANEQNQLYYYSFSQPAFNTFEEKNAKRIINGNKNVKLIERIKIDVMPLKNILQEHIQASQEIFFMNIDVEGMEMSVLQSNDWLKYRPYFVLVESLDDTFKSMSKSKIIKYMKKRDYILIAKTKFTMFFQDLNYNPC